MIALKDSLSTMLINAKLVIQPVKLVMELLHQVVFLALIIEN